MPDCRPKWPPNELRRSSRGWGGTVGNRAMFTWGAGEAGGAYDRLVDDVALPASAVQGGLWRLSQSAWPVGVEVETARGVMPRGYYSNSTKLRFSRKFPPHSRHHSPAYLAPSCPRMVDAVPNPCFQKYEQYMSLFSPNKTKPPHSLIPVAGSGPGTLPTLLSVPNAPSNKCVDTKLHGFIARFLATLFYAFV